MADIFTKADAQSLLCNKTVWLFGDSNVRAIYKDIVWLLQKNSLITLESLRNKLENSYMGDQLVKGKKLDRGRDFQEERSYFNPETKTAVDFMFLTKCLNEDIQAKFKKVRYHPKSAPDIVIINSCVWDIIRWGPEGVSKYKQNIPELMRLLRSSLPPSTLVIWMTTPPLAADPSGGFLIKQIEFMKHTIRFEVMEANMFVRQEVISHGFDVVDIHYHLLLQIHRRRPDGIHWEVDAVRHMSNLLLTHICLALGKELPGNFRSPIVEKMKSFIPESLGYEKEKLQELQAISNAITDDQSGVNPSNKLSKSARIERNKRIRRDNNQNVGGNLNDSNFDIWDGGSCNNQTENSLNDWGNRQIEVINPAPSNIENGYNNDSNRSNYKGFKNRRYKNRKNRNYRPY